MKSYDFFVHPEFVVSTKRDKNFIKNVYEPYLEALVEKINKSQNPVLLYHKQSKDKICSELILNENQFETQTSIYTKDPFGSIAPYEWKRFSELTKGIDIESKIRIHGSYFEHCPNGFAKQICAYLETGINSCANNFDEEYQLYLKRIPFQRLIDDYQRAENGFYKKSNVRLGIMLANDFLKDNQVEIIKFVPNLPFGNLTYQLIDKDTKLFSQKWNLKDLI